MMIPKLFGEIEIDKRILTEIDKKETDKSGMVTFIYNSITWEGNIGESQVQSPMAAHKPAAIIPGEWTPYRSLP